MVVRDSKEALFFITPRTIRSTEDYDESCLWTNCPDLVKAFMSVFEEMWCNSTDVETKIKEIQAGIPSAKAVVISNAEIAKETYQKALDSAEREIIAMTSYAGLLKIRRCFR